jgi:hypothetical protein
MADTVARPTFFEGQILGAADLTATVEYGHGQMARHARLLHSWGIAFGLKLTPTPRTISGKAVVDVAVSSGVAIDGRGLEILVTEDQPLSEDLFRSSNVLDTKDPNAFHPVFVVRRSEAAPIASFTSGACGSNQSTRETEGFEFEFGRPGDERTLDEQTPPDSTEGASDSAWRVLIGFVQWRAEGINRFKDIAEVSNGVGRRYAGVIASEVVAHHGPSTEAKSAGGVLTLRARPRTQVDKPAVVIDESIEGGELSFGIQDGLGGMKKVFKVNAKGDLTVEGRLGGGVGVGVHVQSGVATDGMLLPLPTGITNQQVADGKVTLHVHVTPHVDTTDPPSGFTIDDSVTFVRQCEVLDRRVHGIIRWTKLNPAGGGATDFVDLPLACDYTITAVVPSA